MGVIWQPECFGQKHTNCRSKSAGAVNPALAAEGLQCFERPCD